MSASSASPLADLAALAHDCTRCALAEGRTQVVFGMGNEHADLMFVGEAPGAEEDRQGLPFVGRSGQLLDRLLLEEIGITRDDCYIANCLRCRPPANRDPRPEEVVACRPWLDQTIELVDPRVIVTLGNFASKLLLETDVGITKLRGKQYEAGARTLVPTFHPAAVLRGGGEAMAQMRADLVREASAGTERSVTIIAATKAVEQTRDLAAAIAEVARARDVILLAGDLGAGKTAFVQGFGRGLGITDPITSPTFTLAHEYEGRLRVHHVDVYRLEHLTEVFDIGLPELLDDDAVVIVEWGDVIVPAIPNDYLEVRLELGDGDDDRAITLRTVGQRWASRSRALAAATAPWTVEPSAC